MNITHSIMSWEIVPSYKLKIKVNPAVVQEKPPENLSQNTTGKNVFAEKESALCWHAKYLPHLCASMSHKTEQAEDG